ncbi:hypothetical protein LTR08_002661 [Meristemomyces frigidus]|nr:hypothetical protein LTR08_002661 [Meristemomyces frigidus]
MVPQPESIAQQRCRALASQNAGSSAFFNAEAATRPASAGITYGKSSKPLSLTGRQFRIKPDTYDVSSDENERDDSSDALLQVTAREDSEASDSPLSDAEFASPVRSEQAAIVAYGLSRTEVLEAAVFASEPPEALANTAQIKKRTGKAVRTPAPKPVYPPRLSERRDRDNATSRLGPSVGRKDSASTVVPSVPRKTSNPSARRLPVNELVCVADPPQCEDFADPRSTAQDVHTQDPIAEFSIQPRRRKVSSISDDSDGEESRPRAPLTTIRKRLKTPNLRQNHKVIKRRQPELPLLWGPRVRVIRVGDGFDEKELHIGYRVPTRKQNRRKGWMGIKYGTLPLSCGPLPEVAFECSTDELQLEASGGPHHVSQRYEDAETGPYAQSIEPIECSRRTAESVSRNEPSEGGHHATQRKDPQAQLEPSLRHDKPRVSLSDKEQLILTQLSSVSAPVREWSVSVDGEEDSDDADGEEDGDDEDGEEDSDVEDAEDDVDDSDHEARRMADDDGESLMSDSDTTGDPQNSFTLPPSNQTAALAMSPAITTLDTVEQAADAPVDNGVTLTFRRPAVRGPLHNRSFGRPRLMEVDEAIIDVPDPVTIQVPRSDTQAQQIVINNELPNTTPHRPHRPRSILKNSTPIVPESTYGVEDTAANTRRNSRRRTTMVDIEEDSRYFAQASGALRAPDPATHKVMPRRKPSSYFDNSYVQVEDSERVILETSPQLEARDYTAASQLGVLRQDAEVIWTSRQSLPTVPRDLKSLTRTVSRENGTVSQSVKRRPSLPFHSPTKMR